MSAQLDSSFILVPIITMIIVFFLFFVFMITRFRKFQPNQYVIHLRNGKEFSNSFGGSIWLLPLIDDYIVIPAYNLKTIIEVKDIYNTYERKYIKIVCNAIWKVTDFQKAFKELSWHQDAEHYAESVIKEVVDTTLREICGTLPFEKILNERVNLKTKVLDELTQLAEGWGIEFVLFDIKEIIKQQ